MKEVDQKIIQQPESGAIALIAVILVTMMVSIFAVSLAIMNLDYSLSIGSLLFDKSVMTATDGCLEASIGQLASYDGTASSNITNIGPASMNCSVTITSSGNERYLLASANSTLAFVNTVRNATSTINVATNPVTIQRYIEEVTQPANLLVDGGNVNVSSAVGAMPAVSVDGSYAYVAYRNAVAAGRKMNVAKVDLNNLSVLSTLTNVSSYMSSYENSVIYEGYLYVSYRNMDGTATTDRLSVARIDLNNFSADGITILDNLTSGCSSCDAVYPDAIKAYGGYIYLAYLNENSTPANRLSLMRIDVNDFSASGVTTLNNISTDQAWAEDLIINNGYAYISYLDTISGTYPTRVSKIDLSTMTVSTTLTVDSQDANYTAIAATDKYVYIIYDKTDSGSAATVARVDLDSFTVTATKVTSLIGNYLTADTSGGFLYFGQYDATPTAGISKFNLRTMTEEATLTGYTAGTPSSQPHLVAPGGKYIYQVLYDGGVSRIRLYRLQVD